MHEKSDHEDVALQALCVELRARGHDATIITRPDADPQHPLTVDALFAIDVRSGPSTTAYCRARPC